MLANILKDHGSTKKIRGAASGITDAVKASYTTATTTKSINTRITHFARPYSSHCTELALLLPTTQLSTIHIIVISSTHIVSSTTTHIIVSSTHNSSSSTTNTLLSISIIPDAVLVININHFM